MSRPALVLCSFRQNLILALISLNVRDALSSAESSQASRYTLGCTRSVWSGFCACSTKVFTCDSAGQITDQALDVGSELSVRLVGKKNALQECNLLVFRTIDEIGRLL